MGGTWDTNLGVCVLTTPPTVSLSWPCAHRHACVHATHTLSLRTHAPAHRPKGASQRLCLGLCSAQELGRELSGVGWLDTCV
jgi:hypothetical protein